MVQIYTNLKYEALRFLDLKATKEDEKASNDLVGILFYLCDLTFSSEYVDVGMQLHNRLQGEYPEIQIWHSTLNMLGQKKEYKSQEVGIKFDEDMDSQDEAMAIQGEVSHDEFIAIQGEDRRDTAKDLKGEDKKEENILSDEELKDLLIADYYGIISGVLVKHKIVSDVKDFIKM